MGTRADRLLGRWDRLSFWTGVANREKTARVARRREIWRNQRAEPRDRLEDKALNTTTGALELNRHPTV